MRVVLLHNPSAGSESHTREELVRNIHDAGHDVIGQPGSIPELRKLLRQQRCDLVAVAGGDGTVGLAARAIAGSDVPLTVVPVGTANNLARTFGILAAPRELVEGWRKGTLRDLDLGSFSVGAEAQTFAEAIGFGAFVSLMRQTEALSAPASAPAVLDRDLSLFQDIVHAAQPARYTIELDGDDRSGDYVLVEIMNIPFLGPNFEISPESDPSDGKFQVVLVSRQEQEALVELTALARKGRKAAHALPTTRARRVRVATADADYHHDGVLCRRAARPESTLELRAEVHPSAVQVLVPAASAAARRDAS